MDGRQHDRARRRVVESEGRPGLEAGDRRERIQLRNRVEAHAQHFDWSHMTRYYRVARRWALQKHYPDVPIPAADVEPPPMVGNVLATP